jgi:hypothetical protein
MQTLLTDGVNAWIQSLLNDQHVIVTTGDVLPGFQFYPLLPIGQTREGGGGGARSTSKTYTRTKQRIQYKNKKHVVHTGIRGGKYIVLNEKYVLISRLGLSK